MQLSSVTRSLYTSATSLASNAKLGGSYLLSGVKCTASYASITAHKAADLSLRALSGASYYTIQGAKAIQSSSQIVFFSTKTGIAATAFNAKLATAYLASKAVAGGSHLISGAKFAASSTASLAHKVANISLRVLSSASYYATQSANAVKSHPKIALFTVGTGTAAAVLHLAYRHFKAAPVVAPVVAPIAAPRVAPIAAPVEAPVVAPVVAPIAAPVEAPVEALVDDSVALVDIPAPRDLPASFTGLRKDRQKVNDFLKTTSFDEKHKAIQQLGVSAQNYRIANQIQANRQATLAV